MLCVGLVATGCTSTGYPPALQSIIAQNAQSNGVVEQPNGISVEQLLSSVRQNESGGQAKQKKGSNSDWMYVADERNSKQLNWRYVKGKVLPDEALMKTVERLIEDPKWQLQSIAIGKPLAESPFAAAVLAQKRAVRLQLLLAQQVEVSYKPELGDDKLLFSFKNGKQ